MKATTDTLKRRRLAKGDMAAPATRSCRIGDGPNHYTGAPIPATRVLTRRMAEFKKTTADCVLVIDAVNNTYTFANTYRAGILPPSFDAEKSRYKLDEAAARRLERKIVKQAFVELEPPDWPEWVVAEVRKRGRKTGPKSEAE